MAGIWEKSNDTSSTSSGNVSADLFFKKNWGG